MIPTAEEAKAILEPHHSLIRSVIEEAWAEWKAVRAFRGTLDVPPVLYTRTISNYIFDAIANRAILAFGTQARVRVEVDAQTFKLHFKGLCARFKKGGDDKLGINIPTLSALAFVEADGLFPGLMPDTAKVEFIWLPNELWTDLDRVLVIARDGDRLIWEYDIERAEPVAAVVPMPTPSAPEGEGAPLVTPKAPAKPDTKQQ